MSDPDLNATAGAGQQAVAIHVLPLDQSFAVNPGESVLEAARRAGLRWPSICNGQGSCTVCYMEVRDGLAHAGPEGPEERDRLHFAGRRDPAMRLACQTRPSRPITVWKKGVKSAENKPR
jgi:2Fe-2S ferredoxin